MWPQEPWWLFPFLMCLVLTGIHGYLGLHVLERKVIFVDLAMAQIAALGAAYAVLLGYDPGHPEDETAIYLFSLAFTLIGAAVMSLTRMRKERVPHEAFIGIVYASASAIAILLLSKAPGEGEQIRHMLVGSLLTVKGTKVAITAAIYAVILAFHVRFRDRLYLVSRDPEAAERAGLSVRFWDFLFYMTFGVVITSSVSVGGVLLVFSYLVVPAVIALMFAVRTAPRIAIAWGVGAAASVAGMLLSNYGDFATGPSIVVSFTVALLTAGLAHHVISQERSGIATGRLLLAGVATALLVWGSSFLGKASTDHEHAHEDEFSTLVAALRSDNETLQIEAIHHLERLRDRHAIPPLLELLERTKSDRLVDHAAEALVTLEAAEAAPALRSAAARAPDADLKVRLARALLDLRDPSGLGFLIEVIEGERARIPREEAEQLLEERTGLRLDFSPGGERASIDRLKAWWAERGPRLKWRNQTKRFE